MHARVVTITGARDVDSGLMFMREKVLPVLHEQDGYRGSSASVDRDNQIFAVLSLWDTVEARDASDTVLQPTRQEALAVLGGEDVKVETFEELVAEIGDPPPGPGSALMVTRISMDPSKIDTNIEYFTSDVAPRIKATPGFQGLRNMMDRSTGKGLVGTAWVDRQALEAAAAEAQERRADAMARGVNFDEVSFREIVLVDMK